MRGRTSAPAALATLAAAALLAGCEAAAAGETIEMTGDRRFEPVSMTVSAGTTVAWRNNSDEGHTVTSDESLLDNPSHAQRPDGAEAWDSGRVEVAETFTRTFDEPGEYTYACRLHEDHGMVGVVVVEP